MVALSLENNKFTGMIPTQYAIKVVVPGTGVSPFVRLFLGGNYLFGVIPSKKNLIIHNPSTTMAISVQKLVFS